MQQNDAPLLSVSHLAVRFGDVQAVRDVSLQVRPGEIVTLLGANGAGKSTTLKAICRLVPTSGGDIVYDARSLLKVPTIRLVRLGIALVPERRRLFGGLSVIENLEMGAYGRGRPYVRQTIAEVLELFPGLKRHTGSMASALSGGEQQMLAIGRALMSKPRLILLDEPSLGLAPMLVDQVFSTLQEINRAGTSILLVEQNAATALDIAGQGYVMESGCVVAEGAASDLLTDERVKSAYLGITL